MSVFFFLYCECVSPSKANIHNRTTSYSSADSYGEGVARGRAVDVTSMRSQVEAVQKVRHRDAGA